MSTKTYALSRTSGSLLLGVVYCCMAGAATLPPDSALKIAAEDRFDEIKIEGINEVMLYNQYPETWTVKELTGTWRRKMLDDGSAGAPGRLTKAELEAAANSLLGENPPMDSTWQEGPGEWTSTDGSSLFMSQFSLDKGIDREKQSCHFAVERLPAADIYVNGRYVSRHHGGWIPLDLDITEQVVPGRNTIALTFPKGTGRGMYHESRIVIAPSVYVNRMLLNPDLKKSKLEMDLLLVSNRTGSHETTLRAEINDWGRTNVVVTAETETTLEPGKNSLSFSVNMNNPVYWTPDNPHLYEIRLFDGGGNCLGKERFGFRDFAAKGRHFYLNGKRVFLFGMQWNTLRKAKRNRSFVEAVKKGEGASTYMKRFHYGCLKGLRAANINSIRTHSGTGYRGRGLFEVCDELGILHYDDWAMNHRKLDTPVEGTRDEYFSDLYANRCDWLYYGYNHPSTVMYSFGNELYIYTDTFAGNAIYFYHRMKPVDGQSRPLCTSSGRIGGQLTSGIKDHIDFGDDHCYWGSMGGSWLYNREHFRRCKGMLDAMYGKDTMPLVNFEFAAIPFFRYMDEAGTTINKLVTSEKVDRGEYVRMATDGLGNPHAKVILRFPIMQAGLRTTYTDEVATHVHAAEAIRRQLELIRQEGVIDGIGPHVISHFMPWVENSRGCLAAIKQKFPEAKIKRVAIDPSKKAFIKTPGYYAIRRAYSPELICAGWFDRNLIAGKGVLSAEIYCMNDTTEPHSYTARVLFRDPTGKAIDGKTLEYPDIQPFARPTIEYRYELPADLESGDYFLEMYLFRDGEQVSDNRYEVRVFAPGDVTCRIATEKKVAFYMGNGDTGTILKATHLPHECLKDFNDLDEYQVLIIGADAIDETVMRSGDAIRQWMEAGGRLLCFEQKQTGCLPWVPSLRIMSASATEMVDIIEPAHPVFDGLEQRHLDTWSGKGILYSNVLSPLDQTAVAMGAASYIMRDDFAATVLADMALGKGISVVSVFDVTERYGKDAVATILANNLLKYIVSDESGFSNPVEGGGPIVAIDIDDCEPIDLKPYFNSSFIDEVANDAKGGWDDYGPENDLRNMIVGRQILGGVPFVVVDPRENNDRSCVILRHRRLPHLPEAVEEIKVDGLYNALYFLHTSTHVGKRGSDPLYKFVVHYEDGKTEECLIRQNIHVCDWTYPSNGLPGSMLAWTGRTAGFRRASVYWTEWRNPRSDTRISHIDFVGTGKTVPVLLAVTGYKGSLARGWLSPEHTHHLGAEKKDKK